MVLPEDLIIPKMCGLWVGFLTFVFIVKLD